MRRTGAEITDGFRSPFTEENRSGGFDFRRQPFRGSSLNFEMLGGVLTGKFRRVVEIPGLNQEQAVVEHPVDSFPAFKRFPLPQ